MFATATTCKISAVPTARAQRRARRSVAVRAEGEEETAAPVAVRFKSARERDATNGWMDGCAGGSRACAGVGDRRVDGWVGKNSCRRVERRDGRARRRAGDAGDGDGDDAIDRGAIRERILGVDRFGWMRV